MIEGLIRFAAGRPHAQRPILQAEAAECGLACMAMVANAYGHDVDVNALRSANPVGRGGMSISDLVQVAGGLHLSTRVLRAEPEHLDQLAVPAILHWRMQHYVVFRGRSGKNYVVDDPAFGRRVISASEMSCNFTGIAVEFSPQEEFQSRKLRRPTRLGDVIGRISGWRHPAALILFFSLCGQLGVLAIPVVIQFAVDRVAIAGNGDLLAAALLGFLGVAFVTAAASLLREWTVIYIGNTVLFQTVLRVVHHLQRLPAGFFEMRHVGDVISRIGSLQPIQAALTQGLATAFLDGIFTITLLCFIFLYDVFLGLFAITTTLVLFFAMFMCQRVLQTRQEEALAHTADEQSFLIETIRNIRAIQVFGRENEREAAWQNKYAHVLNKSAGVSRIRAWMTFFESLILTVQLAGFLFIGINSILNDNGMSIGALAALLAFRQLLAARLSSFVDQLQQLSLLSVHLDRLGDVVHAKARPAPDLTGRAHGLSVEGGIELTDVSFSYPGSDQVVLQNVNLSVPSGAFIALTGRSGAGKSTLLKVMLGLLDPTHGVIKVDGVRQTHNTLPTWRRHVGVVMQDDRIFTGTILENVSFFDPEPDMEAARDACTYAEIFDLIESLPMGFHTYLGNLGTSLSGGEIQRLFLARALYRRPKLLFLDEGTANLDIDVEERIGETLLGLNITRIVIAHRPALIEKADQVFTVEAGRLYRSSHVDLGLAPRIAASSGAD